MSDDIKQKLDNLRRDAAAPDRYYISGDSAELREAINHALTAVAVVNTLISIDNISAQIAESNAAIDRNVTNRNSFRDELDNLRKRLSGEIV